MKKQKNKIIYISIIILTTFLLINKVKANTYTTTTNLFENTYTNNLIDMAESQVENFNYKKYAIIQVNNNYYLIISNDATIVNNKIIMNNTNIIQAIRTQENYSYYYEYTTTKENTTEIYINNIIISNIETSKSVASSRYDNYKHNINIKNIAIFILALVFAIFIVKERNY